ncbi:trace amine-associated receptor 1-like [Lethenteron reissneri]|uniref:trace amine-associated receptor 1-like n=1 Tax=Lethenteron reissneri TaxID=7753 RepID=UPI002AB73C88|nr:trace amine-associated receptor 1-like [Lethenteron reissneri]
MENRTVGPYDHCIDSFYHLNCSSPTFSMSERTAALSAITTLILATVLGNLLIITSIAYFRQLQTRTNIMALSLAVADLLVGLTVMPYSMMKAVYKCWFYGQFFCNLQYFLDYMLTNSSIMHLGCIAYDRYVAICDPLRYSQRVTNHTVVTMLLISWFGPALFSSPILVNFNPEWSRGIIEIISCPNQCLFFVSTWLVSVVGVCPYVLSLLTMSYVYARIYVVARRQGRQISSVSLQVHAQQQQQQQQQAEPTNIRQKWAAMKREHSAAKTLGSIIGVYLLSWLPFYMVVLFFPNFQNSSAAVRITTWIGYISSAINPVLYATLNRPFRSAFVAVISCKVLSSTRARTMDLSGVK